MSCCFPRCPWCQEKPIIRNAISYIYLSLSPPASSSRLPTRPCGAPSPSGHTSPLLTPVTTCPSLTLQHSLPEPWQSGLHTGTATDGLHLFLLHAGTHPNVLKVCTPTGTSLGASSPKPLARAALCLLAASAPCPQSPPGAMGHVLWEGHPWLQRLTNQPSRRDKRYGVGFGAGGSERASLGGRGLVPGL